MKLKSVLLGEALENKVTELNTLIEKLEKSESQKFAAEDSTLFDKLEAEIKTLQNDIKEAKRIEGAKSLAASLKMPLGPVHNDMGTGEQKDKAVSTQRFSLIKALRGYDKGKLDGIELEMHEEAVKEARLSGKTLEGFGIPSFFMTKAATSAETANQGSEYVPTLVGSNIESLMPKLYAEGLGARVITGLSGNLDLPRETANLTAAWEGEFDDNANTQLATDAINLTPKRLGAYTDIGKQWLYQTSPGAEARVREKVMESTKILLDSTYFNGSGVAPIPTGLLNTSGINTVAIGTNGGPITRAKLLEMEKEIAANNGEGSMFSFVTTPGVREVLRGLATDTGSGLFVWTEMNTLIGYSAYVTTQIPSTLTKGASGAVCHAIVAGDWSKSGIYQWGPLDIVVDDVTQALKASKRIVVNSWWDMAFYQPKQFVVIKDITTS